MTDDAAELIGRITEHHGMGWLATQLGLSERALDRIRIGQLAATPSTVARLRRIAQQGDTKSGEPMKYRVASERRW
jgi:hypothetical protein